MRLVRSSPETREAAVEIEKYKRQQSDKPKGGQQSPKPGNRISEKWIPCLGVPANIHLVNPIPAKAKEDIYGGGADRKPRRMMHEYNQRKKQTEESWTGNLFEHHYPLAVGVVMPLAVGFILRKCKG